MTRRYKTNQRDIILKEIKKREHEFSAIDIYNKIEDKVGLTTVYRLINKLVSDGKLSKNTKNNIIYYQYLEDCHNDNHFYLKCDICGKLIHIDCDCIKDLSSHILSKHKFKMGKERIIINGTCNNCLKKGY